MNNSTEQLLEEKLHAYVDGFLSAEERDEFEKLLQDSPHLLAKIDAYKTQNDLLHALYDPVLLEKSPEISSIHSKTPTRYRVFGNIAASVALIFIGASIGWSLKTNDYASSDIVLKLAQPATMAHVVYTPEIKHPVEVTAEHEDHLISWLSKRLGKSVHAPSLSSAGFQLVGGRLLPANNGPAAQFMYEDSTGNRLTLYVRVNDANKQDTAFRFYEQNGTKAFYWIDGDLGYALTGSVDKEKLLTTATSVYQQLSF